MVDPGKSIDPASPWKEPFWTGLKNDGQLHQLSRALAVRFNLAHKFLWLCLNRASKR
jgi:hypothetical protein